MSNPYDILGVAPDATSDEIRAAYRKASREAHPDREGGSTTAMTAINTAYDVLKDPARRKRFDETGDTNKVESLEVQAESMVMAILSELMGQELPSLNLIDLAKKSLRNGLKSIDQGLRALDAEEVKTKKIKDRHRVRKEGSKDLFQLLVDTKLASIREARQTAAERKILVEAALALLADYEFLPQEEDAEGEAPRYSRIRAYSFPFKGSFDD